MRQIYFIAKKELTGYFFSPIAYVFICVFLLASMACTFYLGNFFASSEASLSIFFRFHPWLYLFLIPAVGMRLWAEERSSGTLELLLTLPIRTIDAVIGKFLAGWIFIAFSLLLTFPIVFTVVYLGSPDYGLMLTGYLSSLLLAGCYLVVSSTTSAMTQNQVISFVISAMINFLLLLLGWGVFQKTITNLFSTSTSDLISFISYTNHYETISKGLIDSRSLVYFFSFIGFFLYLNSLILEKKK